MIFSRKGVKSWPGRKENLKEHFASCFLNLASLREIKAELRTKRTRVILFLLPLEEEKERIKDCNRSLIVAIQPAT